MEVRNLDAKGSRSDAEWIQDNVDALALLLDEDESGILYIDSRSLDFSDTPVTIVNANITVDITGSDISYSDDQVFIFQNCQGGGISGNGTIHGPLVANGQPGVLSYGIRAINCSKMKFSDFTIVEGNSGIELNDTSLSTVERVKFHEMTGTGVKCTGPEAQGNDLRDIEGRNLAGFLIYGYDKASHNRVSNPRKWIDYDYLVRNNYLGSGKFFSGTNSSGVSIIEPAYSKKNGVEVEKYFIGEEGVGITFNCSHWQIEGGDISGVGDNGISVTGSFCQVVSVYVHDNKHDGIHFYGNNNVAIDCIAENNGKYSDDEYDVAVNGYGFSARPNAGGSAVSNSFYRCVSVDNIKGDFHAGDAELYTPWSSGGATDSKLYCYVNRDYVDEAGKIHTWTLVWNYTKGTDPAATTFGTTSLEDADITINAFGHPSDEEWTDGALKGTNPVVWKWRSSCLASEGPWAHNTGFNECWGNHPTRRFYQDSAVPEASERTNVLAEISSPAWSFGSGPVVFNSVGTGTILYTTVGETATPDLSMRVQRLDENGVPENIGVGTILQKFVGSGWSKSDDESVGAYKQVGRLYSVITALDNLDEPRVSWRINHQPAHHMRDKPLSGLTWSSGEVQGSTASAHGQVADSVLRLPISGAVPDDYNGTYDITFSGTHDFSYALPSSTSIAATTSHHGTLRGNDNDYIGWCLTPDGKMGVGKYGDEITVPTAHIESVDDIAADMYSLRAETIVDEDDVLLIHPPTGSDYNLLKVEKSGLVRFLFPDETIIDRIESSAKNKPFLFIRNGNSQAVTLKNNVNYLRLEGNKDLVLGYNDTVLLLRAPSVPITGTNAGVNTWLQVGGKCNSTDAVTTSSLTVTGTATAATASVTGTATIATANVTGTATIATANVTGTGTIATAIIDDGTVSALSSGSQVLSTKAALTAASNIASQTLDVGTSSLAEITLSSDQTVTTITSSVAGYQLVWLRNAGTANLTLVHDTSKIILTGGRSIKMHPNDFIVIMRHSTSGSGAWSQVGGNVPQQREGLGQTGAKVIPATMLPSSSNVTLSDENMLFFPIRLDVDHPVSGLGVEVQTGTAVASSKVHLSLFNHNPATNKPDVLVEDAGEVATSTDGVKTVAFASNYVPAYTGWHWVCVQAKSNPTLRGSATGQMLLGLASLGSSVKGLTTTGKSYGTSGVPESPAPATAVEGSNTPLCFAQLA